MQEALFTEDSSLYVPAPWPPTPVSPVLKRNWNGFLEVDSRLPLINEAWNLLEAAAIVGKPSDIFLLFSGGYDSLVVSHLGALLLHDIIRRHASHFGDATPQVHVLHINTGIGIPETREFVRSVTHGFGWHYLEYTTPVSYEQKAITYGFPGPGQHWRMYVLLKERALRLAIRAHTPPHPLEIHKQEIYDLLNDMQDLPLRFQYVLVCLLRRYLTCAIRAYREHLRPLFFVTGVRRSESARRMGNVVPLQRRGRQWWLSPLTNWQADDVLNYRDENGLPHSLVVDVLHKSGECLCGAFAKAGELQDICTWFPTVGQYIKDLERRVWAAGYHWGWEDHPPGRKKRQRISRDQLILPEFDLALGEEEDMPYVGFSPLCSSCNARFEREQGKATGQQHEAGLSVVV